jgi:hypothetical protein
MLSRPRDAQKNVGAFVSDRGFCTLANRVTAIDPPEKRVRVEQRPHDV